MNYQNFINFIGIMKLEDSGIIHEKLIENGITKFYLQDLDAPIKDPSQHTKGLAKLYVCCIYNMDFVIELLKDYVVPF